MKKRLVKLMSVVLTFALTIPIFALVGCTDDKDKPRELDDIELCIVGIWKDNYVTYEFKSDGTVTVNGNNTMTYQFRHDGDGTEYVHYERGHYNIIKDDYYRYALFDIDQDKLCFIDAYGEIRPFDHPETLIRQ